MKLIHCADMHLDSAMKTNLSKEQARERKHELLNTFSRLVDYAASNDVSGILICGDLFDVKNISALSRNTILSLITGHPDITFFYLKGNHDENAFLVSNDEMPENLLLFNENWTTYAMGDTDRIRIYGAELTGDNSKAVQQQFSPDPSKINIVMLHGQESVTNPKDKTETINIKLFKNKGINYMALGHVHEYRRNELDPGCVYCYPGCLEGRGFDECGEHGFVLLDIDEEKGTVKDTFVPFAYRHLYEIRVDITDLNETPSIIERVRTALLMSSATDIDMVKVVLYGSVDVECEKDLEFIRKTFERNYYFIKIYDESELKVDYESFALDESLKGEFVRQVLRADDLSDEDKGNIIRMGIQFLRGGRAE